MYILGIILFIIGLIVLIAGLGTRRSALQSEGNSPRELKEKLAAGAAATLVGAVVTIVSFIILITSAFYTQDVGESKVQVSWTGELQGQTTEPGLHFKWPWVSTRTFDVRNNLVTYVGDGTTNYAGNVTTGPQITFQDSEAVTGNMDLTVRYSLASDSVLDIYSDYQTQENFVNKVISETVRAEARKAPNSRTTSEVYSDRQGLSDDIREGLSKTWSELGVLVEEVSIQEIRYSGEVVARFDEAQAARIAVDRAQAEQEAARVVAETRVVEAQGVADAAVVEAKGTSEANDILTRSLSAEILTQRYIDALKNGSVFVVPEGSTPLITTQGTK